MKKRYKAFWALTLGLIVGYLLGPKPKRPVYSEVLPLVPDLPDLEDYINQFEGKHKIKPGNEAEIVWASPNRQQTEYALVYLHGFSASKNEGNPVHLNLAKKLKANLYLPRLAEHGLESLAPMQYLTADSLWESCKEAYVVGQKLGKKVILIGSSTGGTMALKLAATYPDVHSLILISPNIEINDKNAWMLNDPWGLQIARRVLKSDQRKTDDRTEEFKKYWYTSYRIESLVQLQELVEGTMTKKLFQKVKQPVLMLYYYKNELEQDLIVRIKPMLKMFDQLGSIQKEKVAIPNGGNHILSSYIISKDLKSVEQAIEQFVRKTLKIKISKNAQI
ncbi:alpha/beta hydrolase [Pedobacter rhizosphaerae]|uniref:Esterase/lipase n=1 Tax=Pedobacter rhizosphaerae TaxID=390241 RepID=A0A1H9RH42_9SPHI|nr:alpha/beta hydrolase [Pedobacter rhizosphaerae]SER71299.1 Esterase/lipase [Pedobacter rhizosphaerae]